MSYTFFSSFWSYKDAKILIITGELYNFIKKGYTKGTVNVYKPYSKYVYKLLTYYKYDVNLLYLYIMKNFPMPVSFSTVIDILKVLIYVALQVGLAILNV